MTGETSLSAAWLDVAAESGRSATTPAWTAIASWHLGGMIALVELLIGFFGFIAGLAAPAVATLLEYVILSPVKKRERNEETADQRADEGAVECLATLAALEELIPRRASIQHTRLVGEADMEAWAKIHDEHDRAIAQLEASIFALNEGPRKALTQILGVFRYGYDLPLRREYGHEAGWHPDSAHQIAESTVRYCRLVLSRARRREELPELSDQISEYLIAVDDRNHDLSDEFAQEVHESDEAIFDWRTKHHLSPSRKTS